MNKPLQSETIKTEQSSKEHVRSVAKNTEKNSRASLHPLLQMQQTMGNRAVGQLVQRKREALQENKTGLPDNLKAGLESLSGLSMADVNVHYNSPEPSRVQAHAYTKGSDIHIAPGQEKHLPHEAWHVVQQKQGRVTPTMQLKGEPVNDNSALEREADVMGAKAIQARSSNFSAANPNRRPPDSDVGNHHENNTIQRRIYYGWQNGGETYTNHVDAYRYLRSRGVDHIDAAYLVEKYYPSDLTHSNEKDMLVEAEGLAGTTFDRTTEFQMEFTHQWQKQAPSEEKEEKKYDEKSAVDRLMRPDAINAPGNDKKEIQGDSEKDAENEEIKQNWWEEEKKSHLKTEEEEKKFDFDIEGDEEEEWKQRDTKKLKERYADYPLIQQMIAMMDMRLLQWFGSSPVSFRHWLKGKSPHAPEELNCWNAVLYAAHEAGMIGKEYIQQANRSHKIMRKDDFVLSPYIANTISTHPRSSVTVPTEVYKKSPEAVEKWWRDEKMVPKNTFNNIPTGDIILIGSGASHVALSLGDGEMLELNDQGPNTYENTNFDPKWNQRKKNLQDQLKDLKKQKTKSEKAKKRLTHEKVSKKKWKKKDKQDLSKDTLVEIRALIAKIRSLNESIEKIDREIRQSKKLYANKKMIKNARLPNEVMRKNIYRAVTKDWASTADGVYWAALPRQQNLLAINRVSLTRVQSRIDFLETQAERLLELRRTQKLLAAKSFQAAE